MTEVVLDHVHRLLLGELGLCGCGTPDDACELVRDVLTLIADDERGWAPLVKTLLGGPGVYHLVMSALDEAGLIGHGSSLDVAWLTDKGRWYAAALRTVTAWGAVADDGGDPHGGAACTDACWRMPVGP